MLRRRRHELEYSHTVDEATEVEAVEAIDSVRQLTDAADTLIGHLQLF